MVATGYLYVQIPKGFFPQQDTGFVFGEVNHSAGCVVPLDGRRSPTKSSTSSARIPSVAGVFMLAGAYAYNPTREHRPRLFRA